MFSEHTAPIETYDIPIDSDSRGDGACQIWAWNVVSDWNNRLALFTLAPFTLAPF